MYINLLLSTLHILVVCVFERANENRNSVKSSWSRVLAVVLIELWV